MNLENVKLETKFDSNKSLATKKKILSVLVAASAVSTILSFTGCGVRGKPQPPLQPAELGRGQPSFKRATEEFAFPEVPSPTPVADPKNRQESR